MTAIHGLVDAVASLSLTRAHLFHPCGNLSCLEKVVSNEWDTQAQNASLFLLPYHKVYHDLDINFQKESYLKTLIQRTRTNKVLQNFFLTPHVFLALRGCY